MEPADNPDGKIEIVVTGDTIVDRHIYEGERSTLADTAHRFGVREREERGAAALVKKILARLIEKDPSIDRGVSLGVKPPPIMDCHRAFALWRPFNTTRETREKPPRQVWRAASVMGYGHGGPPDAFPGAKSRVETGLPAAHILVIDDGDLAFRRSDRRGLWLLPKATDPLPLWILLEMSRPIAQGDLWHELSGPFADRLVGLVSADDLRHECIGISRGLSWERTVEDIRDGLENNPVLRPLTRCRHLVITFGADGALWVDRIGLCATLIYDAGGAEGGWKARVDGEVVGTSVPMTAALAHFLSRHRPDFLSRKAKDPSAEEGVPDFPAAIEAGLAAVRNLLDLGHGEVTHDLPAGFPTERMAAEILKPKSWFSRATVPWSEAEVAAAARDAPWMIVETSQRLLGERGAPPSLAGLARQVVLQGHAALKRLPHAVFGKLLTADRSEIEALRSLRHLMRDYHEQKRPKKPLSIGVFGPPGAGKSFGVQQIGQEVFGEKSWREFNLSQFRGNELMGAFHQVRDLALSGETPVVFWDEFDSRNYEWLQFLLAPMQDGRFQEGQLSHAIGKCVMIFAGGTSHSFGEFGPAEEEAEARRDFRMRKGPDFHSRLDAYYDVAGPNQRHQERSDEPDPGDVCHPLRRALLIRSMLDCLPDERLDFDSDLLDSLLLVREYKHGARSLEKLVKPLRRAQGQPIRRSSLPAASLVAMHVDPNHFDAIVNRNEGFKMSDKMEKLAAGIHETWRKLAKKEGWKMQPHLDRPYDDLAEIDKEDNRAAARRIPEILALAGLRVSGEFGEVSWDEDSKAEIAKHLEHHLERLAEAEHDGWMEQRRRNGWRVGEARDDARKIHPLLIPYADLPEKEKGKDRNSVRHFPEMVALAGFRIVWVRD